MLDFIRIVAREQKNGSIVVEPTFIVGDSDDLMIRGGAFYAIWNDAIGFWSTDENDVCRMVDKEVRSYVNGMAGGDRVIIKTMQDFGSNKWAEWKRYCKLSSDNFHELDIKVSFSNGNYGKYDYITRTLPYPIEDGNRTAYETLASTLYDPEELEKLEWAIGSVICGESSLLQKFFVLYGPPGSGKSTMLNIIQGMFPGYWTVFDSKALGSSTNSFALDAFRTNPLIAIQHDGDLSRIEDNTRINSITSHERMIINEKFKSPYEQTIRSLLLMGTNKPVKITDSKSGLLRRLVDITPSDRRLDPDEYSILMRKVEFEYPAIAYKCKSVYQTLGRHYYDSYVPVSMMDQTNDFYNFICDNYDLFGEVDLSVRGLPLKTAWLRYKTYCDDAQVPYPMSMRVFKNELKNYFREFKDRWNGMRNVYFGFMREKIGYTPVNHDSENVKLTFPSWLAMRLTVSYLDELWAARPAQYARNDSGREVPVCSWDNCATTLKDIDTAEVHYVRPPENVIVIDFDLKDEFGHKSRDLNLAAASEWPETYAEYSKSGTGIHLHYYYDGDVKELSKIFAHDVEIKTFTGKASLRRKLSWCNDSPIATLHSGLPLKERKKSMVSEETIKSEQALRKLIYRNLKKEIHPNTKPSMDFIYKILEDAYASGLHYDVSDLYTNVQDFAMSSTHNSDYCMALMMKMKWKSDDPTPDPGFPIDDEEMPIVFYDVEVFPNLFVLCYKKQGAGNPIVKLINPNAEEVAAIFPYRLVGFNNRKYDNHICYARAQGYSNEALFRLSQSIIQDGVGFFREAYSLSFTDIYDFLSSQNKMSLKKWEIKLGIHHNELGLPWDQPVPEELWEKVAEYCGDDVFATEATWDANQADWLAREILADISGLTPNDTTNSCTTKLIVGDDRHPQDQFVYTDLSAIFPGYEYNPFGIDPSRYNEGAKIVKGKSIYRGEDPGEGGYAKGDPGMYYRVALLDIASMHPHSAIKLNIFGDVYTMRFKELVDARIAIKHGDFDTAMQLLDGILTPYVKMIMDGKYTKKDVANALKTAINSVYGLTSASFDNALRDPRNVDNIVAKYGALFMINLKHEVQDRGYKVVHIKTDSIKIANADPEIIKFIMEYGREYGYEFEHEATYERMTIVNDSVYIAKYAGAESCKNMYGYVPEDNAEKEYQWTATGKQFQVPYVFKTLFSKEPIEFEDMCETFSTKTALYLDFNEGLGEDHDYHFVGKVGLFCPMIDGIGAAELYRDAGDGKYASVANTKRPDGKSLHRWMESEMVKELGLEDKIDESYYRHLVDEAVDTISKYGDFERFVNSDSGDDLSWMIVTGDQDEVPFMNEPEPAELAA